MKQLFDRAFIDSLPSPNPIHNQDLIYICKNKSADSIRKSIGHWFKLLKPTSQVEMYQRLRDKDKFMSAFYELLLNQFFLEEQWQPNKDYVIENKKIDFFVEKCKQPFFLEVLTIHDEREMESIYRNVDELLLSINSIKTDLLLSVNFKQWPQGPIDIDGVVKKIESCLPDAKRTDGSHKEIEINDFGFRGEITIAYYDSKSTNGQTLYSWSPPGGAVDLGISRIKDKMRKKIKKYKIAKLKRPYIIAVCAGGRSSFWEERAVNDSLYGNSMITWRKNKEGKYDSSWGVDSSGMITPNKQIFEPKNKRLSGVLFCQRYYDPEGVRCRMRLMHNPWAQNPLLPDVFSKAVQSPIITNKDGRIKAQWNDKEDCFVCFYPVKNNNEK